VSRNVTFNENEEPRELEIIEVPGLQVEGENGNPTQQPKSIQKPQETIQKPRETLLLEPRQLRNTQFKDYSKLNDPNT
jgi:hypothetical protein